MAGSRGTETHTRRTILRVVREGGTKCKMARKRANTSARHDTLYAAVPPACRRLAYPRLSALSLADVGISEQVRERERKIKEAKSNLPRIVNTWASSAAPLAVCLLANASCSLPRITGPLSALVSFRISWRMEI